MINILHINHPDVEKAKNEIDYLYQIIKLINGFFPKGYIELQALCFHLYGIKAESILEKLKAARVDVEMPIVMTWDEESAPVIINKILFPLSFIAKASEFISLVKYNKAYSRFIQHKEEVG